MIINAPERREVSRDDLGPSRISLCPDRFSIIAEVRIMRMLIHYGERDLNIHTRDIFFFTIYI